MQFRRRNSVVMLAAGLMMLSVSGRVVSAADQTAPNVVLIMTDDQGIGDFGVMGNSVIETPSIDAMAKRSAGMTTFYVSPVCAPTRASLMTGRYNYRTRAIDTWLGRSLMDSGEVTIAEALAKAGYATGIFGKWHLGDNYPLRPMDQGFEESLVHRGGGLGDPSDPPANRHRYTNPLLFHNGKMIQAKGYCTDVYFAGAFDFIQKAQREKRPFFTYIATNAPHGPFEDVPQALHEHYGKKDFSKIVINQSPPGKQRDFRFDRLARISAMITNVDQNVGRLFAKLEELKLTDNTIVIFLVDNGPNTNRYVMDLRGRKSDVHEGGIRSPMWVQWPGKLEAGHRDATPVAHIDVMPTILEACGVSRPEKVKLDGRSFLPLLQGKQAKDINWPNRSLVIQTHRGDVAVRYNHFMIRDNRWKLLNPTGFGNEGFDKPPKFEEFTKLQLYDLLADPGEKKNLVKEKPQVVARLRADYERWFADVSSTREDNYAPPRIHVGTKHENPTILTRHDWRGGTWDRNSNGVWKIHIATDGRYDVTFDFFKHDQGGTAYLSITDEFLVGGLNQAIKSGATQCVFKNVHLTKGDVQFQSFLKYPGLSRGAMNVTVKKLPDAP